MRMWDHQGCSIIHSPLPFIRSATSFSLSSPLHRHTDYALSLYPRRRCRNHTLSFEHERQGRKTTTRTTDHCMCLSVCVCFCGASMLFTRAGISPSNMCMYAYLSCLLDVPECVRWELSCSVFFCIYLCVPVHVDAKAFMRVCEEIFFLAC